MNIRLYIKDGKIKDFKMVHSITTEAANYYISFLDGKTIKINRQAVGAIHIKDVDEQS